MKIPSRIHGLACALLVVLGSACGDDEAATSTPPVVTVPEIPPVAPDPERQPTCTYHGICWVNPLPQGNSLNGVWAARPGLVFAVGERGTILRVDAGESAIEDSPTREILHDVWGTDESHVVAVGERGAILSRGADGWVQAPAVTEAALFAVWGTSPQEAYAVGAAGTALRWDGSTWTAETVPTELSLVSVFGTADGTKVYALAVQSDEESRRGVVFAREGGTWSEARSVDEDVADFFLDASGAPYLVGADGWPSSGRRGDLRITRPVNAIWAAADDDVFAVAYDGQVARLEGDRWSAMVTNVTGDLSGVSGTSDTDVWAVGADGLIIHWDGTAWQRHGSGVTSHLKAIWGFGDQDIWVVGENVGLHWNGATWTEDGPSDRDLRALFGVGDTLIAAGDDGALYRHVGGEWVADHQDGDYELNAIFGTDADHVFAVGRSTWLESDGGQWREHTERPDAAGVWGSRADDVWVAGDEGLHHWDGASWTPVASTAGTALFDVWGAAPNDVWAAGADGRLLHYDGSEWTEEGAPTSQSLFAIWGRGADDVWAIGDHGTILHFDGTEWRWRDSGTDNVLHSVWGTSVGVWFVGHGGTILRYGG